MASSPYRTYEFRDADFTGTLYVHRNRLGYYVGTLIGVLTEGGHRVPVHGTETGREGDGEPATPFLTKAYEGSRGDAIVLKEHIVETAGDFRHKRPTRTHGPRHYGLAAEAARRARAARRQPRRKDGRFA
jgi:hypothetical protein